MQDFVQLLTYSAGSICLGIAFTVYLICALSRRHKSLEGSEGCLVNLVLFTIVSIAVFFFVLAAQMTFQPSETQKNFAIIINQYLAIMPLQSSASCTSDIILEIKSNDIPKDFVRNNF